MSTLEVRARRGWAAVLRRLGQADGAQAEFEAISLHEARGGGPSALSHLELGVVLAVFVWIRSVATQKPLRWARVSPLCTTSVVASGWEASAGLGWVEDET